MFYLFVFLKLPIVALGLIVWWAIRAEPDVDPPSDDGGSERRRHPREPLPRSPRRGPHGDPAPGPPPRVRSVTARGRVTR